MAFFRPPSVPVVFVVSTLHCQCGTALAMTPMASQRQGAITAARPTKQAPQKIAFQIFLRAGTAGQPAASCRGGFSDPGGVAADDALPMLPMLVITWPPSRAVGPGGLPWSCGRRAKRYFGRGVLAAGTPQRPLGGASCRRRASQHCAVFGPAAAPSSGLAEGVS